ERPESFTLLDQLVDAIAHRGIARVGEDASAAQGAGAKLHSALEPGHDLPLVEPRGDVLAQAVERFVLGALASRPRGQGLFHLVLAELRPPQGHAHAARFETG